MPQKTIRQILNEQGLDGGLAGLVVRAGGAFGGITSPSPQMPPIPGRAPGVAPFPTQAQAQAPAPGPANLQALLGHQQQPGAHGAMLLGLARTIGITPPTGGLTGKFAAQRALAGSGAISQPGAPGVQPSPFPDAPLPPEAEVTEEVQAPFPEIEQPGDLQRATAQSRLDELGAYRGIAESLGSLGGITSASQILSGLPQQKPFQAEGIRDLMRREEVGAEQRREQQMAEIATGARGRVDAKKALSTERTRILSDTRVKNLKSFRDAAHTVMKLVKSGNPLGARGAAIKMARAMGDVGALSKSDIKFWLKRPGAEGTLDELMTYLQSKPTKEFLEQLHATAETIYKQNIQELDSERQVAISSFKEFNPGANTKPLENLFGKERPQAEVTRAGFVSMTHPRLGTMAVPKNKVNAALRKNWTRA